MLAARSGASAAIQSAASRCMLGPRARGICAVGDVPDQHVREHVLHPRPRRAARRCDGRAPCCSSSRERALDVSALGGPRQVRSSAPAPERLADRPRRPGGAPPAARCETRMSRAAISASRSSGSSPSAVASRSACERTPRRRADCPPRVRAVAATRQDARSRTPEEPASSAASTDVSGSRAASRPRHVGRRSSSSGRAVQTIERGVRAPLGEVLDEIEHAVVRPVQVLEREHEQAAVRATPLT